MPITVEKRIELLEQATRNMEWLQRRWARLLRVKVRIAKMRTAPEKALSAKRKTTCI